MAQDHRNDKKQQRKKLQIVEAGLFVCPISLGPLSHGPFDPADVEVDESSGQPICPECGMNIHETF